MRKLLYLFLLLNVCLISCKRKCTAKDCGNGGCNGRYEADGCSCNQYYVKDAEGSCTVEARSKLAGTWRGNHVNSGVSSDYYNIVIEPAADIQKVKVKNFFNYSCPNGNTLEVYMDISGDASAAALSASLCTEYEVDGGGYNAVTLLDPTHLKIEGAVRSTTGAGTIYYSGIYELQP